MVTAFLLEAIRLSIMLTPESSLLLIVDVQEKLARAMYAKDALFKGIANAIKGVQTLGINTLLTEQNPNGLGLTIPEISELLTEIKPIRKFCFSCCDSAEFRHELNTLKPENVFIAGIEAHICVYQTARDLIKLGYDVQIISDAVSSRTVENKQIGLQKSKDAGAGITSVETVLFELLKDAQKKEFKEILNIVK